MSTTNIRAYIKARALEIDSNLKELNDPFGDNEVGKSELRNGYKIIFNETSMVRGANYFTETFPVIFELYREATRDIVENFDKLFDKALDIRGNVIDPAKINDQEVFTDVIASGVQVLQTEENDYALKGSFRLEIRKDFSC